MADTIDKGATPETNTTLHHERKELLTHIEKITEAPVALLGLVWLILLILQMTTGLSHFLQIVSIVIWVIFIADFILRLIIAPDKKAYLKREWLIAISLFIPAIRLFSVFRVVRVLGLLQGTSIVNMIASVNRSMRSLNKTLKRRGFIYVIALTIAVILIGAAGMYTFEKGQPQSFESYPDAVWWTTMLLITIGSEYWPQTSAGKTLALLISIYGFSVLGYITATLASFFVGRDAEDPNGPVAGTDDIAALRKDIDKLIETVEEIKNKINGT